MNRVRADFPALTIVYNSSKESSAFTHICIFPSRYNKSIDVSMDCIYQAVRLSPKHLRHIQSREWFSILLPLCYSLFVKSSLHRCIRHCCYGGYCMLRKLYLFCLSSFRRFFESISISLPIPVYFVLYCFI